MHTKYNTSANEMKMHCQPRPKSTTTIPQIISDDTCISKFFQQNIHLLLLFICIKYILYFNYISYQNGNREASVAQKQTYN